LVRVCGQYADHGNTAGDAGDGSNAHAGLQEIKPHPLTDRAFADEATGRSQPRDRCDTFPRVTQPPVHSRCVQRGANSIVRASSALDQPSDDELASNCGTPFIEKAIVAAERQDLRPIAPIVSLEASDHFE